MMKKILIDKLEEKILFMENFCMFNKTLTNKEMIELRTANSLIDFGKYKCLLELKKEIEENF